MSELLLGFDIGGTKVALAIAERGGPILARLRRPTEPSGNAEADLARLVTDARKLLAEVGASSSDLAAVGASVPGPFDPKRGVLLSPPNMPGWNAAPVREVLADALGCAVHLESDANAAAIAEWHFGAGRGAQHLAYLTMSTGVGGGLVLDGRLYRGARLGAGEIGHVPVEWGGERCACGLRGCLEAYVGGAAWTRRLGRCTPTSSAVATLAGSVAAARPEHVVEAARAGDAWALSEFERFTDYLARGIVFLAFALDLERVVLGTIAVAAGEALCFDPLRSKVAKQLWPGYAKRLAIVPASLGDELPYRAALAAAELGMRGD